MKFNCGLSSQEKFEAKQKWHVWFAWRPVRVGSGDCRWLEYVDRKFEWIGYPGFGSSLWNVHYAPLGEGKD